jgi:prepilin-type N-terminal cleavage/methylation domain-containing protein
MDPNPKTSSMICHYRHHHRGFTLLEVISCLGLIALVLTLASQLLHSSFNNIMHLTKLQAGTARIDHCVAALRHDIWESKSIVSTKLSEITLKTEGAAIVWTATDSTLIRTRTAGSGEIDTQRWTLAVPVQFEPAPSGVTVIVRDRSTEQRIAMIRPLAFMEARP